MDENTTAVVYQVPVRDITIPTTVSPEAQRVLASLRPPRRSRFDGIADLDGWRAAIAAQVEVVKEMMRHVDTTNIPAEVEIRDLDGVPLYVARPMPDRADDRVVFEVHGGALVLGGGEMCRNGAAGRAARTGIPTWSVDYRMPPDHPYPTPLDDCMAGYRALLAECSPDRVIVTGGSAGGNIAAALILRARDEGLPLPAVAILGTPQVDLTESGDTFRTNMGVDTVLTSLMPVNLLYAGGHDLKDPYVSPLFGDLTAGFPPTLLYSGTRDLFLSNTVLMHRALRRAGIVAELHILEAASHSAFFGKAPEEAELVSEVDRFVDEHCPPRS